MRLDPGLHPLRCKRNGIGIATQVDLGLQPKWSKTAAQGVQDSNKSGSGIAAQMDPALPCRCTQFCFPVGSEIATGMLLELQKDWDWDCSTDGFGIAMQLNPGLNPWWVCDCNPNGSRIAKEWVWEYSKMGLGLEPIWAQDCSTDGPQDGK